MDSLEYDAMPRTQGILHCLGTNAIHSGVHPFLADTIVSNGSKRKDVRSVYLSISDEDFLQEIDKMEFDMVKTEIWPKK